MSTTNTTVDTSAIKSHLAAYEQLNSDLEALDAQREELLARREETVRALALVAPKSFNYGSKRITVVIDGGKGGNSAFLRGMNEPKAAKAKEVLTIA